MNFKQLTEELYQHKRSKINNSNQLIKQSNPKFEKLLLDYYLALIQESTINPELIPVLDHYNGDNFPTTKFITDDVSSLSWFEKMLNYKYMFNIPDLLIKPKFREFIYKMSDEKMIKFLIFELINEKTVPINYDTILDHLIQQLEIETEQGTTSYQEYFATD